MSPSYGDNPASFKATPSFTAVQCSVMKCHLLLCYICDLHLVHELRGVETSILSLSHTSDLSEIRSTRNNSDTATTTCFFMNTSIRSYTVSTIKRGFPTISEKYFYTHIMSDQNVPAPYILLKQQMGERKPNQEEEKPMETYFFRGEILLEIPEKQQIPREDGTPPHNYCKFHDPAATTYDSGTNVSPLYGAELDYLLGIYRSSVRAVEYLQVDKMAWIMDLRLGSKVFFQLDKEKDVPLLIQGKIRYYGAIPGHDGVMFGIEIIVSVINYIYIYIYIYIIIYVFASFI